MGHIIWSCESSKDVWAKCCHSLQKCSSDEEGFPKILEILATKLSEDELQLAVGVARQIWLRRNSIFLLGIFLSPATMVLHAKDQLQEFQKAKEGQGVTNVHYNRPRCVKWERPKEGYIKLNWYAAINRMARAMRVGVVA